MRERVQTLVAATVLPRGRHTTSGQDACLRARSNPTPTQPPLTFAGGSTYKYPAGLTGAPPTRVSKCRWSPKQWPVQPTLPMTWPWETLAPLEVA